MPFSTNVDVQFCLAQTAIGTTWQNNNERGVMRYQVPTATLSHTINTPGQNNLLTATGVPAAFPFQSYLNIWLVNEIVDTTGGTPNTGVIGYAAFPGTLSPAIPLDGIVMIQKSFGSNVIPNHQNILMPQLDQGNILTHEVGHYFSMLHTFEFGNCVGGTNATCALQGDLICDTPPSNIANTICNQLNTCPDNLTVYGGADQFDMLDNFMCYADDGCMTGFTAEQASVMQGVLGTAWPNGRMDMTSAANLAATGLTNAGVNCCPTGVTTAHFQFAPTATCNTINFSTYVPACSMNQTYSWQFGDGTTFNTTAASTAIHNYSVSGVYNVTLTVTGTNGSTDVCIQQIQVGTYAQSTAKDICNNSVHGVNFHVSTRKTGIYNLDLNFNGVHTTHTYTIMAGIQTAYNHPRSEDIEFEIPVNLPQVSLPATHIYTITLTGDSICPITYIDTFRVVNCCNNVVTNGDFSNGWTNHTHPNGGYVGNGPGIVWTYTPSAHFDSPICGIPSTCTALEMLNTSFPLQANTNYHANFQLFGGNPSSLLYSNQYYLLDTLFLNARILDNTGTLIQDLGTFPVLDLVDSTYHHFDFIFNNPTTISNAHLSISQVKNFYSTQWTAAQNWQNWGWGYDYSIDNISIRAIGNPPTITSTPSTSTACPSITTTLTASGAATYSWTTGVTTNTTTVSPSSTTIYTVIGTSVLGCTATAQSTVNVNPSFIAVTPSVPTICIGQTTTLTASGAFTYSWSPGGITTASIVVSPTTTTVYTVTGTNTVTGCNNIKTVTVTVNPLPTLSISPTTPTVCLGSIRTLTASGASTYTWNTGVTTSTISVTPTVTTNYTVTGTSSLSCNNTKTITVTVYTGPSLSVTSSPTTICVGQPSTLTASGANTYVWMPGTITLSQTAVYPSSNTTYSCTGTNTLGCTTTKTLAITVTPLPTVTAVSNPTLICSSQSSTLTAGGASTYTWSTGTVSISTTVSPTITTTYTVTGKSAAGCSNTKTVTVNVVPYTPVLTASSTAVAVCSSGSATMSASGANTYTWNPGASTGSTLVVTPTVATVYTVSSNYSITGCGTGTTSLVVNPIISTLCCAAATSTLGTSLTNTVSVTAGTYTTSSAIIYVQGCVTFTDNTSYSGYTFRMAPGASIRVHPNKTLTLTNCKLYSCSELWDGIYLMNDLNYWCGNIIVSNSTIEDMYNGIVMDYNNMILNPSAPSGTISITSSSLNKNYVSVQMKNNNAGFTGSATNDYLLSMKTSTISSNSSTTSPSNALKPSSISSYTYAYNNITNGTMGTSAPYLNFPRAFIGIKFNDLCYRNNAIVGDFATGSNTNTFDNLDFGINGTNVTTKVYNNYFKNITGSAKQMDLDSWTFPASGPDEIGIAVTITETATANYYQAIIGDNNSTPTSGNPFPRGNKFEDCNKGIQVKNTRYTTAKANYFTANTTSTLVVTTTGTPPMQITVTNPNTYYFYKAQNAEYITSIGTTGNLSYNYIRNHATGIYANHTIVSGGTTPALDITDNDIASPSSTGYCMQAIQVDQAGGINFGTDKLNIYNNTIEQVYRGIIANGVLNGLLIKQNPRVFIESTSKTLNYTATQPRTAISLTNCQNGYVKGNVISSNTVAPTSTTTAQYMNGVYVTNSINSKVECNSATALGRCFIFQQSCTNSSWKVNAMSNSYTGLEMRTGAVIGQQGANTGNPNLSANTWSNITRQTYAVNSTSVNITSKLFVLAGATTQPTLNFATGTGVNPYSPGFGGINTPTAGTSYTCSSGSAQRLMNGGNNSNTNNGNSAKMAEETDTLMIYTLLATQDENAYEVFPEEMTYLNQQSVFKLLEEDSIQAVSGTVLDNFYQNQQNSAIDKLTEVQNAIANYDTTIALLINTTVATKNNVEYKHQRANELVLKYMQNHVYLFNPAEMSELFSMAAECIEKGYYVVQCRNLVNIIQNTVVNFTDNCEQEANASRRTKPNTETSIIASPTNFYLYPNPNNGSMILDYDLGGYNNAIVNLYDITGKVIGTYKLQINKGVLQMNEQNLNNGVYFYSIFVGEKTIKTDKIVIIK